METYEARLASYGTGSPSKKGTSTAKSGKSARWPHHDPSPTQLAKAGFYWDPNDVSTDRVTCCLCQTILDGWEANDDPIQEHFNYSPECAIAIHAKIEQDVERGVPVEYDPNSEAMLNARKDTFRDLWPHEKKRGWTCKTQKMAEAGWYYCPTEESDDFVKCAYCGLSLDGWEPKDKPFDEHQRRSASCMVVTSQSAPKAKSTRAKKSRASKASRLSTQSTATTANDVTMADTTVDEGDTVLTTVTDTITSTTTTKGKKGTRAKKGKSKSNAATATTESAPASSMLEPEDDDFEVKIISPPAKPAASRKRKSDEMDDEGADPLEAPAPKRRGGRARSSTVQPETMAGLTLEDTTMDDDEDTLAKPAPKRKGKATTRSRAASTKRKPSAAVSVVSQASFQDTVPADEELEAALEADLDRPLSDEEVPPPKPARSRAASKSQKTKKVVALANRESTASTATMQTANEEQSTLLNADETFASAAPIKNPKQRGTRKGKARSEAVEADDAMEDAENELSQPVEAVEQAPAKGRKPSRKASTRQVSRQKTKAAAKPAIEAEEPATTGAEKPAQEIASVSADVTMIHNPADDLGTEEKPVKAVKRAVSTAKKGRKGKAAASKDQAAETQVQVVVNTEDTQPPAEADVEVEAEVVPEIKPKPTTTATKAKTARIVSKSKKKAVVKEPELESESEPIVSADKAELEPESRQAPSPLLPTATLPPASTTTTTAPVRASTPVEHISPPPSLPSQRQMIPSPTPSPQSSDAENHPPSSRPSAARPPLVVAPVAPNVSNTPSSPVATRVPLAVSTPTGPRSNMNVTHGKTSRLATAFPWSSVDLEYALVGTPRAEQENVQMLGMKATKGIDDITSPEKKMTVEEWIRYQAAMGQQRLRDECERTVQRFENQGVRALKALEGIVAVEE